ncbi:MAG: circadian clock protein KaiC [Gemmatimonadaceae bacterium]|nr:circadian clock protein KaiC [Gemmatimonadaceae bacterium]
MKTKPPRAAITKLLTGIDGFDQITGGGLPRGRTTLVVGGSGCGKTVFALQTLVSGANLAREAGIFVAFEEPARQVVANAGTFGWDLPALTKRKLFFLDARLTPEIVKGGDFDLVGLLGMLEAKAKEIHATRIVFDGIDVLLTLLDDENAQRREVYRIRDWLLRTGLTGIITQKVHGHEGDRPLSFLQFMVDCVVILQQKVVDGAVFRTLRVMKYRGSGFAGDEFPVQLTSAGLQLTNRGPTEFMYKVSNARVSSGLDRLDHMLNGGYYRGSNILVSGAPGTAKSTLAGLFAAAACERGDRTLFVSFDEGAEQIVRNLRSVGIHLGPHVKSGLLTMTSTRTRGPNVEDQFGYLRTRVLEHRSRCVVFDPLSALADKLSHAASADAAQQFLDFLKVKGITVLNTYMMEGLDNEEPVATRISTSADTWVHLSYVVQDGERNRALTIVKSRGMEHSNQVRELTLSSRGASLTDVYIAQGKALMGVARWQREQEERAKAKRTHVAAELTRHQLQLMQAEAAARLQVIQTEMDARSAEIAVLADATGLATTLVRTDRAKLRKLRHADVEVGHPKQPRAKRRVGRRGGGKGP